jgi:hypothetical protein
VSGDMAVVRLRWTTTITDSTGRAAKRAERGPFVPVRHVSRRHRTVASIASADWLVPARARVALVGPHVPERAERRWCQRSSRRTCSR